MKTLKLAAVIAALCLTTPAFAQGAAKKNAPTKGKAKAKAKGKSTTSSGLALPEIKTWSLPNGLQVAYMGVHKAPVVTVQVWYHVGAKEEARNRRGSAHMFEHMMFKGTDHVRPEEHARHLNRVGGYVNAFTTEDVTAYHDTVPKEYLDFAVQLESERMSNLIFRPKMIATEKEVVKEEIRQQENNPISKGFLRFLEIAFTKHPYAWTAGGTIKDLDQTTPADLEKFYKTYYIPNNAILVVVGDVTEQQVRASADKWFKNTKRGAEPPRPADKSPEPKQTSKRREVVASGQIGIVIAGYHVPEATHADAYALQILSLILGGGGSSRLHRRLVRKDKLAVQAGSQTLLREHPGLMLAFSAFLDPSKIKANEAALVDEMKKLAKVKPSAKEVTKAKNQILASFVFGLESVTGLASQIGMSWIQAGDPRRFLSDLERYDAVTAADVQLVAKKYLKGDNLTVVVIPPAAAKGGK